MKISTKFMGVSVLFVGAIVLLAGGSAAWRHYAGRMALEHYSRSQQQMRLVLELHDKVHEEISHVKDELLFQKPEIEKQLTQTEGEEDLYMLLTELERLSHSPNIAHIRQRFQIFETLEESLVRSRMVLSSQTLPDYQYNFLAMNGYERDIEFFLDQLTEEATEEAGQAEAELAHLEHITRVVSYGMITLLLLLVLGQFWGLFRPIIRSLRQLQQGAIAIGSGNLGYRLTIQTGDEIEQVAESFNQMAENLHQAQTTLNQKLDELDLARVAAESASHAKSEFLANMNHELRTPLNGILGYAQILQQDPGTTGKQLKGLQVIQQCGSHLLTLINDILDLAKLEVQKMQLYPQDFHFSTFLISTVEICRIKAEQKGIGFDFRPDADLPTALYADDKRLRQVLLNLLSNAIKFTDQGQVTLIISDRTQSPESTRRHLYFEVSDTGIGIPPDKLATIFLPFEQAGQRDRNLEGTGLGLAISEQIVQMMDSTIQVESQPGQGSRFWFEVELPLASEWLVAEGTVPQKIIGYQGERRIILVIDDRIENRAVLMGMLSPLGFQVEAATNGQLGLELALQIQPDAIITDVMMPEMTGLEMTRQLRQLPDFAQMPIIASPASFSQVNLQDVLDAGCNGLCPKPIDLIGLLGELQRFLKLEWIYETPSETGTATDSAPGHAWIVPPAAELKPVYQAARNGFIADIQQEAQRLQQLNPDYTAFSTRLLELSQQFDDEAILELLRPYVQT